MAAYTRGTVYPATHFNPEQLCEELHKAMKGFGTDEHAIIKVIGSINNQQRQQLKQTYQGMYGKDLCAQLKGEISGKFEEAVLGLMETPVEFMVHWLHKAMKGLGTDEQAIIEILCGKSNQEIRAIRQAYHAKHGSDLEESLKSELSGEFCHLICAILAAARDENSIDFHQAEIDAEELHAAGVKKIGTDESKFISILNMRSFNHLREVFKNYERFSGKPLEQDIGSECSGNFRDALLAIVAMVKDAPGYFADRLHNAMQGVGTDDNGLIRIVIMRSEIDLADIKSRYEYLHGKSLSEAVASETGGDYEKMMLKIIG